jgi:hypothetical protein
VGHGGPVLTGELEPLPPEGPDAELALVHRTVAGRAQEEKVVEVGAPAEHPEHHVVRV